MLTFPTKLNDKDIPLSGRGRTLYEKYTKAIDNYSRQPIAKTSSLEESILTENPNVISQESDVADLEFSPSQISSSQDGIEASKTIAEKEIKLDLPGREELELLARKRDSFKLPELSSVKAQNTTSVNQGLDVTEIDLPEIAPAPAPAPEKVNGDSELELPSPQDAEPISVKDLLSSLFAVPVKVKSSDTSLAKDDLGELQEIKARGSYDSEENDMISQEGERDCEVVSGDAVKSSEILSPSSSEVHDILLPELPIYDREEQVESEFLEGELAPEPLNNESSELKSTEDKYNELEELSENEIAKVDTKTAKIMLPELMELHKGGSVSSEPQLNSSNDFQEITLPDINPVNSELTPPPVSVPQVGSTGEKLLEKSGQKKGKMLLGHGSVAPVANTKVRPASKVKFALITLLIIVILVGASFLDFKQLKSDFESFFSDKESNEQTLNQVSPKAETPEINSFEGEIPATDVDSVVETAQVKDDTVVVIQTANEVETMAPTKKSLPLMDSFSAKEERIKQSDTEKSALVHNEWHNLGAEESALRVLPSFSK